MTKLRPVGIVWTNNNNNDFITVFLLKGGSSSVKIYINIKELNNCFFIKSK